MPDQKTLNNPQHGGSIPPPESRLQRNVAAFLHDVIDLFELQVKLFGVDIKETIATLKIPLLLITVGLVLFLGMVPVALAGLGMLLHQQWEWSIGSSFLTVSFATTLVVAILLYVGIRMSSYGLTIIKRSQSELQENVRWVKAALVSQQKPRRSSGDPAKRF